MSDAIMSILNNKKVKQSRWDTLSERFGVMQTFADATIEGVSRSLIISGPAGVGKSFGVEKALKEMDEGHYTVSRGYVRATALLRMAWRHRHEGHVIVFDDADSIFGDETSLNLLKALCDTCEDRWVSYKTERPMIDEEAGEVIPQSFKFEGSVIFLTNYDFDDMIEKDSKWSPHFAALVSRSHYIDLAFGDKADYVIRIEQVMKEGLLSRCNATQQEDVIDFIYDHMDTLRELSLRIALKIADVRLMKNVGDWKAMARVTCCKNPNRK